MTFDDRVSEEVGARDLLASGDDVACGGNVGGDFAFKARKYFRRRGFDLGSAGLANQENLFSDTKRERESLIHNPHK